MIARTFAHRHGIALTGHGVGLRRKYFDSLDEIASRVDWVEIISENFMSFGGRARAVLEAVAARIPVVPHGVNLSIGGPDPLRSDYLADLRNLCRRLDAPYFSDHICFTSAGGVWFHDLVPVPFTREAAERIALRARQAAREVGRPIVLENVSYYAVMPGSDLDEGTFLRTVVERADCGLLLDVNNVYVNAVNHGYDPVAFMDALPLERVVQVHMAGHRDEGTVLVDDHGSAIPADVLALYEWLVSRIGPVPTLVEWDFNLPDLGTLLAEVDRTRAAERRALRQGIVPAPVIRRSLAPAHAPQVARNEATLAAFFDAMGALLLGKASVEQVERTLGPSPSGADRLAFYRDLVEWDHRHFLGKVYPRLASLAGSRFEGLCDAYLAACPPSHWEPNRTGEGLAAWLEAGGARAHGLPAWASDLARYEWVLFSVATAPEGDDPPRPVHGQLAVRPTFRADVYEWGVAAWVASGAPSQRPPERRQHVVVSWRDPDTLLPRLLEATPWTLLVLTAVEKGQDPALAALSLSAPADAAVQVTDDLVARGLLVRFDSN